MEIGERVLIHGRTAGKILDLGARVSPPDEEGNWAWYSLRSLQPALPAEPKYRLGDVVYFREIYRGVEFGTISGITVSPSSVFMYRVGDQHWILESQVGGLAGQIKEGD